MVAIRICRSGAGVGQNPGWGLVIYISIEEWLQSEIGMRLVLDGNLGLGVCLRCRGPEAVF